MESRETQRSHAASTAGGVGTFGALVRRYRLAAGLTQRELAQRAHLSLRGINALELGHRRAPRSQTIARLARALDLSPADHAALEAAGHTRPVARAASERPLLLLSSPLPPDNLPLPPTPLLGREREVAEVTSLLRDKAVRLVTLTGPGGVGKTRLALDAAQTLRAAGDVFPGGVSFVPLASLRDPTLVIPHVARTLGLSERGGISIADTLRAFLRDKPMLLVLDNFEHLTSAATDVAALLEQCAGPSLLVTSRAPLQLRAEHLFPVVPLANPQAVPTNRSSVEYLVQYPAVALFVERARAAQPGFRLTDTITETVAAITTRLDGLPLAIELAAARTRVLSPAALLARLTAQLTLLTGGARDAQERQRTMRATLAWSEDLLNADERALFRRLAVFEGGGTLEAVEAICLAPAGAAHLRLDILEGVGRLVDQSLLQRRTDGSERSEPRFEMLHVTHEYALEQLGASGEMEALQRAHAHYFLDFAERTEPVSRAMAEPAWLPPVRQELGNLRAALVWAHATGEAELGLRLATAIWRFWMEGGYFSEGQQWLEALLALAGPEEANLPVWLRARALADLGMLLALQRQLDQAVRYLGEGIALGRVADDWLALVVGLEFWGAILRVTGQLEQAAACFEEVLAIGRARGEALAIYTPLASLGQTALAREDWGVATARFTEAMAVSRSAGHMEHASLMLQRLGEVALRQHDTQRAATLLRESIGIARVVWAPWALTIVLELLATAYAEMGQHEQAARLFGAVATQRAANAAPYVPAEQLGAEALVSPARAALSKGTWAAAFAAGCALSLEEAIAEALAAPEPSGDEVEPAPQSQATRVSADGLTAREREVLRLLAQGWSDAQIAAHLVISPRTVNHHTAAIYGKLGVTSRAAAAHLALERHLL